LLGDLERKKGRAAREAASQVGLVYTEFIVRELYHEVVRSMTPIGMSLEWFEESLRQGRLAEHLALNRIAACRDHLRHTQTILEATRRYVSQVTPVFQCEYVRDLVEVSVEATSGFGPVPLMVTATEGKTSVTISFGDMGQGIAEEDQRDLFVPFKSQKVGGTGLGLPLVKRIIEVEHRGAVRIYSRKGTGTVVEVELPIQQDAWGT
jgi:phosphoglycerate-specific signal transduction histidine kinase